MIVMKWWNTWNIWSAKWRDFCLLETTGEGAQQKHVIRLITKALHSVNLKYECCTAEPTEISCRTSVYVNIDLMDGMNRCIMWIHINDFLHICWTSFHKWAMNVIHTICLYFKQMDVLRVVEIEVFSVLRNSTVMNQLFLKHFINMGIMILWQLFSSNQCNW